MKALSHKLVAFFVFLCLFLSLLGSQSLSDNPTLVLLVNGFDWPFNYGEVLGGDAVEEDGGGDRRSLFWLRRYKYISYGALSANRVPCPPRSGRSYYTHNCFKARGPVHPYSRGCSMMKISQDDDDGDVSVLA